MKGRKKYLLFLAGLGVALWVSFSGGLPGRLGAWQCLGLGNRAYQNRTYGDAEVWFRRSLQKGPGFGLAWYHLGNALYQQERYREAIGCYRQAQTRTGAAHPEPALQAALWANLGNAYYRSGRLAQSQWAYQNALVTTTDDHAIRQDFLFVQRQLAQQRSRQPPRPEAAGSGDEQKTANEKASKDGVKQSVDPRDKEAQPALSSKTMENIFDQLHANETNAESKLNKGRQLGKKVASDAKDY